MMKSKLSRRQFLHLVSPVAALPAATRLASAQTYPSRTVTIIVPFAAGGPTDLAGRIVAEHMSRMLGQQFIVENVVGAGGTTGSTRTMRAAPDGYTIQMGQTGTEAASVALYPNLVYRPDVDFEPIGMVVVPPILIAARKDFPAKDLKEFMAYARANPDKLNMAHAGVGSITHFTCLMINALVAGQVDYVCDPTPDIVQQLQGGTLRVYAIASPTRSPILPDVPTTIEAGLPEFQVIAWYGCFAPRGTPKPILDKLSGALDVALDNGSVRKRLLDLGCDIPDKAQRGQAQLAALVKSEIARWGPIIKAA